MNKLFLTFTALYVCIAAQSRDFTSSNYAGGAAEYLKLPVHASSAALGTAVTAWRDDLANAQYNPAILDALPQDDLYGIVSFSLLANDRKHYGANIAGTVGTYFVLGISYVHYGVGNIDERTDYGDSIGSFDYGTNAIAASAAGRISNNLAVGATVRMLLEKLYSENAGGAGLDFGATYQPLPYISLGASIQNVGSYLWWNTGHRDQVLPTGRVGVCGKLLNNTLLIETDFIKTQKQPEEIAAGIQYFFLDLFFVRGGLNTAVKAVEQSSKYPDYSLGLGMRYLSIGFDYACQIPDSRSLESSLGLKHKLSFYGSIKRF